MTMALTYTESAALMKDVAFVDRMKVACVKFANFILINPQSPEAAAWAKLVLNQPDKVASVVAVPAVLDVQVQADGAEISDANLQSAAEVAAVRYF